MAILGDAPSATGGGQNLLSWVVGLTVAPVVLATTVYTLNLNIVVGIIFMILMTVAVVWLSCRWNSPASTKWVVESAFELCAITSLVAAVTAAIPIYDHAAVQRQRQTTLSQLWQLKSTSPSCLSAADVERLDRFYTETLPGAVEIDRPDDWKAMREHLQATLRACSEPSTAFRDLVANFNAYTKSLSDHSSYGVVRSSLSVLNDIKASVFFTVIVIFYLCHSLSLKIVKAIWLSKPN